MNSKDKGNIAETIALAELTKLGVQVSVPFGDNARYDLVGDFNGGLQKLQVKYCGQTTDKNSVVCYCSSSLNHTTNKQRTTYCNDIDFFIFYIAQWDKCLLVPVQEVGTQKTFNVRRNIPKNNQQEGIHLLDDYVFENSKYLRV